MRHRDWLDSPWDDFFKKRDPLKIPATGISRETLEHIINKFSSVPEGIIILSFSLLCSSLFMFAKGFIQKFSKNIKFLGFNLHRGLDRTLKGRQQMLQENCADWAMGEALAFGSLLLEGLYQFYQL